MTANSSMTADQALDILKAETPDIDSECDLKIERTFED